MDVVEVSRPDGSLLTAQLARTFTDRLFGLSRVDDGSALLLNTRSVHALWFARGFVAVGIDEAGTVVGSKLVRPGRVVWFRRARWILELPETQRAPAIGSRLEWHGV